MLSQGKEEKLFEDSILARQHIPMHVCLRSSQEMPSVVRYICLGLLLQPNFVFYFNVLKPKEPQQGSNALVLS